MVNPLVVERGFKRLAIAAYVICGTGLVVYVAVRCYKLYRSDPVLLVEHVADWGSFPDFCFCSMHGLNATFFSYFLQGDEVLNLKVDKVEVFVTRHISANSDDCVVFKTSSLRPTSGRTLSWLKIRLYFTPGVMPSQSFDNSRELVNGIMLRAVSPTLKGAGDLTFMKPRDIKTKKQEIHDVQLHKERVQYDGPVRYRYRATTHIIGLLTNWGPDDGTHKLWNFKEGARKPGAGEHATKTVQAFLAAKAPLGEPMDVTVYKYKSKLQEYQTIILSGTGQIAVITCLMGCLFPKKFIRRDITATVETRTLRGFQDRGLGETPVNTQDIGFNSFGSIVPARPRAHGSLLEMPSTGADGTVSSSQQHG